jgi:hypothetical protein
LTHIALINTARSLAGANAQDVRAQSGRRHPQRRTPC